MGEDTEGELLSRSYEFMKLLSCGPQGSSPFHAVIRRLHDALASGEGFVVHDMASYLSGPLFPGFSRGPGSRGLSLASSGKATLTPKMRQLPLKV